MRVLMPALAIAVTATPSVAQNRAADEAAVRVRVTALEAAINQRDAAAYAALFAADGDLIVLDGAPVQGRAAIEASSTESWAATRDRRATITPTSIRFVGPDIAIVNTLARFTVGATTTEDRGTWVLHREGGAWLITALRVLPAARP